MLHNFNYLQKETGELFQKKSLYVHFKICGVQKTSQTLTRMLFDNTDTYNNANPLKWTGNHAADKILFLHYCEFIR